MFKLLRYFSITSFIAFTIVAVLLGILYRQIVLGNLHDIAEDKNVALTQAFSNSLWADFAPFVENASALPPEELKNHPEIARLRQAVLDQMAGLSVVKVKIYDLNGLTVFSTEERQIGDDKSSNVGFLSARSGQVISEFSHRDTFSAFEGEISNRNLFSSYVPIQPDGPATPVEGVIEVYDDLTPLLARIEQTQRTIIGGTIAILVVLYGVLFVIVKRADNIIKGQYHQLTESAAALRASEERFRQVVASISHHIYVTQVTRAGDRINRYISPNVETLTGYPLEKVMNDWNFWPSTIIYPEDRAVAAEQAARLVNGQDSEVEYRLVKANEQIIWVRDSGRVERDPEGQSLMIYGVVSDISVQKQAEVELRLARDQAVEASRLKTRLLANVSHDLRTPLNAILGYTEMLQEGIYGPISEQQQHATAEIIDSTGHLLSFVNNLLDQAQIEAGKVVLNVTQFSPAELVENVQSMLNVLTQAKNLKLISEIAPDVPSTLPGDPYWLNQILVNLVSNAIKFTDEGSIQIRIYLADVKHWAIAVTDTGPGISVEARPHIFEAFQQAGHSITRQNTGNGLGLSIVKELTTLMGGQIKLESEVGQGSTFTVLIPLVDPATKNGPNHQ